MEAGCFTARAIKYGASASVALRSWGTVVFNPRAVACLK